jgi:HEPN domain-containing protein
MRQQVLDNVKLIRYWVDSSDEDYETMEAMYSSKRYTWALFVGHLMIEKLLKAYYVKVNEKFPPYIHNLLRLAENCQLELNQDNKLFFVTVTAFNINARYDDFKQGFKKKCTREYTTEWVNKLKEKRSWIKSLIRT